MAQKEDEQAQTQKALEKDKGSEKKVSHLFLSFFL